MGRRRRVIDPDGPGIPSHLFWGIDRRAFPYVPADPSRNGEALGAHRRWTNDVRAAGYTVSGIREAALTDKGYLRYCRRQDRRDRLIEREAPGPSTAFGEASQEPDTGHHLSQRSTQ